ncbi:acrB/AcrD/AcrF family protein [Burkholderia gladioli]|uniref:AcrB/AcrD/AcrF family protein n=1 Tax=Burkholderia gladioli TaxID=28095 RepID=A0A095F0R2_BURGA|nr:efflux RND transporter permease subunit [Burkholderia gladioli]AJW98208.1 acrB/AcrD/AcrF family protein [Burkholderia gladioli]ASD79908.1 multidrug efflux protein [Burkholderia gladioli pv. gladioli]AWY54850.1 multidrug efflux protein [Burkholderia gladioli pv. gladioli]KGC10953.1 acrB/AcrD/AcrF family protein [Burkholderia gladioli]PEH37863.1 multidrug efflux protein [Burkholderia gladioli]
MKFTDIFVRRPVLACVISLMILVIGYKAFASLPILEYPKTENAVVTVTTTYYGADPQTVAGFVTTPLENAIAQANGIDYLTSKSIAGTSTITANLVLNFDADKAVTEISTKINSVLNQLPSGVQQPTITVAIGQSLDALIIGYSSDELTPNQITDYLVRNVQPRLQAVKGVQTAELLGPQYFAMRAWLDPQKLAAYGLTATDVTNALAANSVIAGLGTTKGQMVQFNLTASTDLHSAQQFRELVVKQVNGGIIRLKDVANVTLGSEDYESGVSYNGKKGVYLGIQLAPSASLLDVIKGVKAVLPDIQKALPTGLHSAVIYDSTVFVDSSIREVEASLVETVAIVTLVVFAFLGSPRSVMIPVVAIPLSLVGTFGIMLMFGFSINLLTLLALVLAIGLVVDDAIIVVESVSRHLEEGMRPRDAAIRAARDLASPIIAMTVVLIAVYVPIGFRGGLTGALFTEFAFTLVGAVTTSAVVSLTLSPMMCGQFLKPPSRSGPWVASIVEMIDRVFGSLQRGYERSLRNSLRTVPVTLLFAGLVVGSIYFLYTSADSELAPQEDQGVVILQPTSAPNATLQQKQVYGSQVEDIMAGMPEAAQTFQIESPSQSIGGVTFKPWDERHRGATEIQRDLQNKFNGVAGQKIVAFQPPPLPGSQGLPIQFVLKSTQPLGTLNAEARQFLADAAATGMFLFIDSDLKIDQPQIVVDIDRDKASELGLTMTQVGTALGGLLGGGYTNYFSLDSRSYKVIAQVQQRSRLTLDQIMNYRIATVNNVPIPLSSIGHERTETVPETINHFQQVNSATISGVAALGVSQEAALKSLQALAARTLPADVSIDYAGPLRQLVQESSGFVGTFVLALIIIYLSLAALFESFRDPLVILISIPMSVAGALIFISLGIGGASLNIYTEVGLVTLMGLISKHGILIVEVANEAQHGGMSKLESVVHAAGIRLRPILMTTAAMVLGVVPLILSTGAGAASRFNMGLVIASGLAIGTIFTLFVLPAVYLAIAARHVPESQAVEAMDIRADEVRSTTS